jgi:hypothetical protein
MLAFKTGGQQVLEQVFFRNLPADEIFKIHEGFKGFVFFDAGMLVKIKDQSFIHFTLEKWPA